MVQRFIVKLPNFPAGIDTAQISIRNIIGKSNSVPFELPDFNQCNPPSPPIPPNPGGSQGQDLEEAYTLCLDSIADLFCTPVTGSTGGGNGGTEGNVAEFYYEQQPSFRSGGTLKLFWEVQGTGNYTISYLVEGSSPITLKTGNISDINRLLQEEFFNIPRELPSGTTITYAISIDSATSTTRSMNFQIQTYLNDRPIEPSLLALGEDNNISDAKKEFYTLNYVAQDFNTLLQNPDLIAFESSSISADPLKINLRSFYIRKNDFMVFARDNIQNPVQIPTIESEAFFNNGFLGTNFYYKEKFPNYNGDLLTSDRDLSYEYQKPYTTKEASRVETPYNSLLLDVKSEYNSYLKQYEEIHVNMEEKYLPNLYFIELNKEAQQSLEKDISLLTNSDSQETYTMELDPNIYKMLKLKDFAQQDSQQNDPVKVEDYYSHYVKNYQSLKNLLNRGEALSLLSLKLSSKNIFIPQSFYGRLENYNSKKHSYPFYNEIKFSFSQQRIEGKQQASNSISSLLKQNPDFENIFVYQCMRDLAIKPSNQTDNLRRLVKQEYDLTATNIFQSPNRFIKLNRLSNNKYFDLFVDLTEAESYKNFIFLENYIKYKNRFTAVSELQAQSERVKSAMPRFIQKRFRSYEDILKGKKAYSETIFYRIAKYEASAISGLTEDEIKNIVPMQNIIIARDPDRIDFTYIDTQVKYGKKYSYRIYSYDIMFGNELSKQFDSVYSEQAGGRIAVPYIQNTLGLYLVENLYDSIDCITIDKPPLYPQVDFVTYKDNDNKLLISLNGNNMRDEKQEVIIKEEDEQIFERIRQSQFLDPGEPISFGGDDTIKKYQILRTTVAPKSYADFDDGIMKEISTRAAPESIYRYNSIAYNDDIEPNTKYYYTFRCVDIHDQLSNPTEVYRVEMINESGTIYPVIDVWEFPKNTATENTKSLKKLIMIQPQLLQRNINFQESANMSNLEELKNNLLQSIAQDVDKKIWNKTYKMRLVSKHTNKVYDIKFKFDKNGEIIV